MTISNEAVEAVAKAISDATYELAWTALPEWVKVQERKDARRLLEAAAGIIRAEALNDSDFILEILEAAGVAKSDQFDALVSVQKLAVAERGRQ